MKPLSRAVCVSLCAVLLLAASMIAPTMARYSNTTYVATQYGGKSSDGTLSATTKFYDFGIYTHGVDAATFAHTVRVVDTAPVSGVLRFAWDDATRLNKDIAVFVDSEHYISVQNSGYFDYSVSSSDNVLEMPFSLLFSSPEPRQVTLDVSFYPDGADEATLFARYFLAVVDEEAVGSTPSFVSADTAFLSDSFLMATVTTPADVAGVWLSTADGVFAAGTCYCTASCADGATLLRDSAIYLPRTAETASVCVDLSVAKIDTQALTMRVAASDTRYSDKVCTPVSASALTVSLSDAAGILSADRPLVVTLTPSAPLQDSDWSHRNDSAADLSWQLFRRQGDEMVPITEGAHLTVTTAQTQSGGTLTLATPGGEQPAGTYLLMVTQYYHGYLVSKTPIWFFIDYR